MGSLCLLNVASPDMHISPFFMPVYLFSGAFVVSWTPYSIVSLWTAVGDFYKIPIWIIVAPAVFAKCSIIWNPIIYVIRHDHFRKAVQQSMSCPNCFRFDFRTSLSFKTNFYNTCLRHSVGTDKPSSKSPLDEEHQMQYLLQNHLPTIIMKRRSTSFTSYFLKSSTSFRQCRFKRHATLNIHVQSSHDENYRSVDDQRNFFPHQQNIKCFEENRDNFMDSETQSECNGFDDNYAPDTLFKLVQTDQCINYSRVIQRSLGNNWRIGSNIPYNSSRNIVVDESSILRNSTLKEALPRDETQNGHRFILRSRANLSFYPTTLTNNRKTENLSLEKLKSAQKLLKRQIEMLYNAQCRSSQSENTNYTDNIYFRENNYQQRRLLDDKRNAHQTYDLLTVNLPSTTRKDNGTINDMYDDDDTSLCMLSGRVQNCESNTMNKTQITELCYFRRNDRKEFGEDFSKSAIHLLVRQTSL
jgi:hypothetical protein